MKTNILLFISVILFSVNLQAQIKFQEKLPPVYADFTGVSGGNAIFVDIDNDQDPDVLLRGQSRSTYVTELYVNQGGGQFLPDSGLTFTAGRRSGWRYGLVYGWNNKRSG